MKSMRVRLTALVAAAVTLCPLMAFGQGAYPGRTVRMIVPFAPGGASDFVGRIISPRMSELLGQQIVIENRAGAAGNIGMEAAAKAAPDGYTVYLGNIGTVAINPAVFPNLAVNPLRDFIAVTQVVDVQDVLVANPSFAPGSVKEFVAHARANPGKLNYGSPGSGSQNRLEMELLRKAESLDMVHIPYKGGAGPAATALVAGEVQVMFTTMPSAVGFIQGGRLKSLATTGAKRNEQLASVPTMVESGYADFVTSSWQGVFVPAGTPREIVARLNAEIAKAANAPDVREKLVAQGFTVLASSPEELNRTTRDQLERYGRLFKQAGIKAD